VKYLATPANVNSKGWLGWAPLHKAAQLGHPEIVRFLVQDMKAEVNIRDLENHTPLMLAAGASSETPGHVESVKTLVANNADVNAKDDGEYSSLHLAVLNGNVEVAKVLLAAKCDVNHKNIDGFTALHTACGQKNMALVQLLLDHGADASIKDAKSKTATDLMKKLGVGTNAPAQTSTGPNPSSSAAPVTTDDDKPKFPWELPANTQPSTSATTSTTTTTIPSPTSTPNELQKEIEKALGEQV